MAKGNKYDNFLDILEDRRTDTKWNIFRFQDHLLYWISLSAHYFLERAYNHAFEALAIVYSDSRPFFDKKEVDEIDEAFNKAQTAIDDYMKSITDYEDYKSKGIKVAFETPSDYYHEVLNFRIKLMQFMGKHNMLMTMVKKSMEGTGGLI